MLLDVITDSPGRMPGLYDYVGHMQVEIDPGQ
jgi:hypothetical protein